MLDGTPLLDIKPYVPEFDVRDRRPHGLVCSQAQGMGGTAIVPESCNNVCNERQSMIDLMKLQAFSYAAESLSLSDAAKRLHLSQPTNSRRLSRSNRNWASNCLSAPAPDSLTDAGRLLMSQASKLLHEANAVEQMMDSLQEKIVGQITRLRAVRPLASMFCRRWRLTSASSIPA